MKPFSMGLRLAFVCGFIGYAAALRADDFEERYRAIADARGRMSEAERLHALFAVDWDYAMASSPESATYVGVPGHDTRWTDWSPAAVAERKANARRPLDVLATIDREALSAEDRVNYDLFKRLAEEAVESNRHV